MNLIRMAFTISALASASLLAACLIYYWRENRDEVDAVFRSLTVLVGGFAFAALLVWL
jgi:hypothetical protein